jgi:hypothetical protein
MTNGIVIPRYEESSNTAGSLLRRNDKNATVIGRSEAIPCIKSRRINWPGIVSPNFARLAMKNSF